MIRRRLTTHQVTAISAAILALTAWGCSGHGSSSMPTGPSDPIPVTGASVTGDVTSAGHAAAGVRVTVDGQPSASTTDTTGRFVLGDVAPGDRVLLFTTSSDQAPLPLKGVQPGEQIQLEVDLAGSQASVRSMNRQTTVPPGPLTLQVSPDSWNTQWSRSSGTVTVFFRGTGFDTIDPASVVLEGDDPAQAPLAPRSSRIEGGHLRATFGKADAFSLLLAPVVPGQMRTVVVGYVENGATGELSQTVRIVGPAH